MPLANPESRIGKRIEFAVHPLPPLVFESFDSGTVPEKRLHDDAHFLPPEICPSFSIGNPRRILGKKWLVSGQYQDDVTLFLAVLTVG